MILKSSLEELYKIKKLGLNRAFSFYGNELRKRIEEKLASVTAEREYIPVFHSDAVSVE